MDGRFLSAIRILSFAECASLSINCKRYFPLQPHVTFLALIAPREALFSESNGVKSWSQDDPVL
jgi:hypothetical protein